MAVFSLMWRRRASRRRHNPTRYLGGYGYITTRSRKRRAVKRSRFGAVRPSLHFGSRGWSRGRRSRLMPRAVTLRNPSFGTHRPVLIHGPRGWHRPRRSKLLRRHARINPRRFRRFRRNPKLPFQLDKVFIGGAKVAAGIAVGFIGMPLFVKLMPATLTVKYRKFYGLLHVVAGAVTAAMVKNRHVRDAALIVAGTGVYDLLASNVPMLGLPQLPGESPLLAKIGLKGDEPGVIGLGASYQQVGADYAPALGASYQEVGADDIAYGSDDIEIG